MRRLSVLEAYREAINQEMERDPDIFVIGEDVQIGGSFGLYTKMVDRFGHERILNTPISEIAYTGMAIGAAMAGKKAIIDFQFSDFIFCAMDQFVNQAAKMHYMSDGQVNVPVIACLPVGANRRGAQHAQCNESIFMNVPGLKIVCPATPYDAKGLIISAIRDPNPVLVFQHKLLYSSGRSDLPAWLDQGVPEEAYMIPIGKGRVVRAGSDVTIVASMLMLYRAMEAAEKLSKCGIKAEVIDPRTIVPLDIELIAKSVSKTKKLVIAEECPVTGGWGSEIVAGVCEAVGEYIQVKRIGSADCPMPYAEVLEKEVIPQTEDIYNTILNL